MDYLNLARELEQYANIAQQPPVWRPQSPYYGTPANVGDTAGAQALRNWAAILRSMAYDESRHKSNLEVMRGAANNLRTLL